MSRHSQMRLGVFIDNREISLQTGPFGTQLKAKDYVDYGTPVINVRNIGMGSIIENALEYISDETRDRLASHILSYQDIVFGRKGAVERHAYISLNYDGWFQGSDCIRMRIESEQLLPRYVSYCLLTPEHKLWMSNHCSHGATMASLNQDIIKLIPITIYDISTQEKIVAVLSKYDVLIENNNRRIAILEEMAQRLYREWFVYFRFPGHESIEMVDSELGVIPEGWRVSDVGSCCSVLRRGISPKYNDNATGMVLNQKCIRDFSINLELARNQEKMFPAELQVQSGDVLINSTGVGTLGRVAQMYENVPNCTVDSHITLLRPHRSISYYIGSFFREKQDAIMDMGVGSTGQTELNRDKIKALPLLLPDNDTVCQYEEYTGNLMLLKTQLQQRNVNLRKTRDHLLPRLISGDIDVSKIEL